MWKEKTQQASEPSAPSNDAPTNDAPSNGAASDDVVSGAVEEKKPPAFFEVELDFGWAPMDPETTAKINEAVAQGESSFELTARGSMYLIDLGSMEQINMMTGMARSIRRCAAPTESNEKGKGKSKGEMFDPFSGPFGTGFNPFGNIHGKGFDPSIFFGKGPGKGGMFDDSDSGSDSNGSDVEDALYEIELDQGWMPFDGATARKMKEAEEQGQTSLEYQARGHTYIVDFKAMTQTNKRTKVSRPIRRVEEEDDEQEDDSHLDALPGLRALHGLLPEPPPAPPKPTKEMPRLSPQEITETIERYVPEASTWIAPRSNGTKALEFLIKSYDTGLPAFPAVSAHLAEGVRIIVWAVRNPKEAGLTQARAKDLATQLAESYTNCQAVQARVIDALQAEIRGVASHSLSAQVRSLVEDQREMALDRTVCHFHPQATITDDGSPHEQLPHLANRYRRHLGKAVGMGGHRLEAARTDRNAQLRLPVPKKQVLKKFWSEFVARDIVRLVAADVNQTELDVQRRISLDLLMKWAGKEPTIAHRIFYDESTPELYGDLSLSPAQRNGLQPVLHEALAVELVLSVLKPVSEEEKGVEANADQNMEEGGS